MTFNHLRKVELHCHVDGLVSPDILHEIGRQGYPLPVSPEELRAALPVHPTSNVKTGSVARIEDHPVQRAKELGLNFSLNTDDPGPFECSMDSEYQLLAERFGFDENDFEKIAENALKARFQPKLRYLI